MTVLHAAARQHDGRTEETPSMVVIDTHLARGAPNSGFTFHDKGGPYGRTEGTKRVVAVDVTGLPVGALVVPASTHEDRASELMLEHVEHQGVTDRLDLVLWAWRVEVAHGRLGRSRRLARSFENTTTSATGWLQVACIATTLRHLSRARAHRRTPQLAA
ncbi:hypothetical protein GHK92_03560 [Nocardioides sp. dk4132]|uniref:hypothetical protein n=1 Tax=unclassified Nocardioides TaxID=2615069 RepID=UPI0012974D4D|nr:MULTISPECIES: hypothetical protein [unclassified Nocardioides]MQW74940.1 hypothetical protein [Nocardioides sp. dk4132]QGA07874.1 hypothetical protein GFH29_11050 [Nocardioides sp. dk884]